MSRLRGIGKSSVPILVAIIAGFAGGWCATVIQSANAQTQQGSKVVRANRLELVDGNGKIRCLLQTDPAPLIRLIDANGKAGVILSVGKDGKPLIAVNDKDTSSGLLLGASVITFATAGEKPALVIGNKEGHAQITFYNLHDQPVTALGVNPDESGGLYLFDAYGRQKQ